MILKEISYLPFCLNLKTPFNYFSAVIKERKGFIIKCIDEKGNIGYGECSPLPGFSKETLEEAEEELNRIIPKLIELNFPNQLLELESALSQTSQLPSVKYGIELAIFNLLIQSDRSFVTNNFGTLKSQINVNAVIGIDEIESVLTKAKLKVIDGYKTVKLKIGREDPFEDFYLIVTLRNITGYDFKLRLDANKKWSADEAIEYLSRLKEFDIEYIEEPCEYVPSTFRTAEETHIPAALDESLESLEQVSEMINSSNIQFIVIKPMILGGLFSIARMIKEAEIASKKIIISSSFESAVGKSGLVFLTSLIKHNSAHGLDTADFFEKNICDDPYPVINGSINFDSASYPPKFNL